MIPTIRGVVRLAIAQQKAMGIAAFHSTLANTNKEGDEPKEVKRQNIEVVEQTYIPSKAKTKEKTVHNDNIDNTYHEAIADIGEQGSKVPKTLVTTSTRDAIRNIESFLGTNNGNKGRD